MSATAESLEPRKKRAYNRKPIPEGQEPPVLGKPPRKVPQDSPTETPEYQCTIPNGNSFIEETPSGEKVRRYKTCTNEAKYVPLVTFIGQRREESPPGSKQYVVRTYKYPVRYGKGTGICEHHKALIEQDPRVLVSGQELQAQEGNMRNIGLPKPNPKLTKITFEAFVPPSTEIESAHMDSLLGIENEDEIETL